MRQMMNLEGFEVEAYGNLSLLSETYLRIHFAEAQVLTGREFDPAVGLKLEAATERTTLDGYVLVTGYSTPTAQRSAVVPLRWGAPRIVVAGVALETMLGKGLDQEPFRAARLWRYQWDPKTDLAISVYPASKMKGETPSSLKRVHKLIRAISGQAPLEPEDPEVDPGCPETQAEEIRAENAWRHL